jgi:hypothetical protein
MLAWTGRDSRSFRPISAVRLAIAAGKNSRRWTRYFPRKGRRRLLHLREPGIRGPRWGKTEAPVPDVSSAHTSSSDVFPHYRGRIAVIETQTRHPTSGAATRSGSKFDVMDAAESQPTKTRQRRTRSLDPSPPRLTPHSSIHEFLNSAPRPVVRPIVACDARPHPNTGSHLITFWRRPFSRHEPHWVASPAHQMSIGRLTPKSAPSRQLSSVRSKILLSLGSLQAVGLTSSDSSPPAPLVACSSSLILNSTRCSTRKLTRTASASW